MAGSSSVSSRSRDSKIGEEASVEGTLSSDNPVTAEDGDKVHGGSEKKLDSIKDTRTWTSVSPTGSKPRARYYHAAAVIGRKMLVVGGDSDLGMLNDVQQLHLGKLTWSELGVQPSYNSSMLKGQIGRGLPACRGHSLVTWGKTLLLVTGETDPPVENVAVWSFDLEKEGWSRIEAKGEIPVARTGHSVTRAGSVLILFGGEDVKGHKLNDLHMFDLKSLMWLPLLATGTVPSPRSKHVAAIYDDRLLLVFGGASKSKVLNDLYSLDFEAMEWSRLKTRGVSPGPRAECAGVLFGDRWYIAGGEATGTRCLETIMLDVARMTWSVVAHSINESPSASQGFSMVIAQRKERAFLVSFGGKRPGPANEVEVLHISATDHARSKSPASHARGNSRSTTDLTKHSSLATHDYLIADDSGVIPLRKKFLNAEKTASMAVEKNKAKANKADELPRSQTEVAELPQSDSTTRKANSIDTREPLGINHSHDPMSPLADLRDGYERKLATALRKNAALEVQLKVAMTNRDEAERSLASVINSRQKTEKRLAIALKEIEDLKRRLEEAEIAQEESNNLANVVHTENIRLDHDLAFLKAVLEDTQKELHTTRGVLSGERSRAFHLQVELFELKQTLQSQRNLQTSEANKSLHT